MGMAVQKYRVLQVVAGLKKRKKGVNPRIHNFLQLRKSDPQEGFPERNRDGSLGGKREI